MGIPTEYLERQAKAHRLAAAIQAKVIEYLREGSLYKQVPIELAETLEGLYPKTILLYCVSCKAERPYHDLIPIRQKRFPSDENYTRLLTGTYPYDYACTGCELPFQCWVFVDFQNNTIEKIGQKPSVADMLSGELSKYRKILGDKYSEFSRAVGLYAHGVGVGSFVYLRRIFERLINEAYDTARKDSTWDESAYQRARMDEKIVLLKGYLPQVLIDNAGIYSILSKGIHSLSEDECLTYFNTVKVGIELILDEKIEREERQRKLANVANEISRIKGSLS
ncbi:MAG: hypothetical protein QOG71_3887 [Pyrinomonadaceae bacterium]|nr:hypothetical protein [Pyrinomonadaceae bacterium]